MEQEQEHDHDHDQEQEPKYKTHGDKIIFSPTFDEPITPYYDTISKYHELIFDDLIFGDRTIQSSFNRRIDFLPDTLTTIKFNHHFNAKVCFPNPQPNMWTDTIFTQTRTLKNIVFGYHYNAYTELPSSVINLTFGHCFNKPIDFSQNHNLTNITFGEQFNQMIVLPKNLLSLTICNKWNCRVVLPEKLESIRLNGEISFNFPICQLVDNLPNSVKKIDFGHQHIHCPMHNLPNSVKTMMMCIRESEIKNIRCLPKYIDLLKISIFLVIVNNPETTYTFGVASHIKTLDVKIYGNQQITLPENVQNVVLNMHDNSTNKTMCMKNITFGSKVESLEIISSSNIDLSCINFQTMSQLKKLVVRKGCGENYWDLLPKSLYIFENENGYYYNTFFGWIYMGTNFHLKWTFP